MKGHKDKDGKFHPHTQYKRTGRTANQTTKSEGVRMKRNMTGNKLVFGTRREQVRPPQEILRMINHYRRGSIPKSKYQQEELDELYWAYNNGKGRTRDEIIFRESNYPSGYVSYKGIPDDPKAPEQVKRRLVLSWVLNRMVGGHNVRMSRERPTIKLENRANEGIRAYTKEFHHNGMPLVLEITTHHPRGSYMIEPYWRNYPLSEEQRELTNDLQKLQFSKFNDAKSFIEKRFSISLELDRVDSNNYQTWEKNIKQTDHELPFDKLFWSLPEDERNEIHSSESIEHFLKRKGISK